MFRFYTETESFDVSMEPKQTEDPHPNSLKESIFGYFKENLGLFRFVSDCYETVLFVSVVSIYVRNTETNRNFLFLVSQNKPKQPRNRSCFGLNRDTLGRGHRRSNI